MEKFLKQSNRTEFATLSAECNNLKDVYVIFTDDTHKTIESLYLKKVNDDNTKNYITNLYILDETKQVVYDDYFFIDNDIYSLQTVLEIELPHRFQKITPAVLFENLSYISGYSWTTIKDTVEEER